MYLSTLVWLTLASAILSPGAKAINARAEVTSKAASQSIESSAQEALKGQSITLPDVDFQTAGKIALGGNFQGLSLVEYRGQQSDSNGHIDCSDSTDALVFELPSNYFIQADTTNGIINGLCSVDDAIYFGGSFTTIGSLNTGAAAGFNTTTDEVFELGDGLPTTINTVYCDTENKLVYFGGTFNGSVAIWNVTHQIWNSVPFGGFESGVVNSIVSLNNNIIFGGKFDVLGNSSSSRSVDDIVTLQSINLETASISTIASSNGSYSDPRSVICSASEDAEKSTWLLEDGQIGLWTANFSYEFFPTKLRLRNSGVEGYSTKLFRLVAYPNNGILNFTYTDWNTGETASCDAFCPLPNITEKSYQDYEFVNVIGVTGFSIYVLEHYGNGGGLSEVAIYQEQVMVYAVDEFNEPTDCGEASSSVSKSVIEGSWDVVTSASTYYMMAYVANDTIVNSTFVDFYPDISVSGNYSILLFTPGCKLDSTCDYRGQVNATIFPKLNGDSFYSTIYQTNYYEKYDTIFNGYFDVSDETFRPYVRLQALTGQNELVIVAEKMHFVLTSTYDSINGLFEFDPKNYSSNGNVTPTSYVSKTAVNNAGNLLDDDAEILSLVVVNSSLVVGGDFKSNNFTNFFVLDDDGECKVADHGLNGTVKDMILSKDEKSVIVGGEFGHTGNLSSDLQYIASYSLKNSSWSGMNGGLNGPVNSIERLVIKGNDSVVSALAVSGNFSQILKTSKDSAETVNGLALWIESEENWSDRTDMTLPYLAGCISSSAEMDNSEYIIGGDINYQTLKSSGFATLDGSLNVSKTSVDFMRAGSKNSNHKRSQIPFISHSNSPEIYTGTFLSINGSLYTVVGGRFSITANETIYDNLVIFNEKGMIGGFVSDEISSNYVLSTFNYKNTSLILGGSISGEIATSTVDGIVIWDLLSNNFSSVQPEPLSAVERPIVHSIAARPGTNDIVVAGSFSMAGSLDCKDLCVLNMESNKWSSVTPGISGNISSVVFIDSNTLIVSGNMTTGDGIKNYFAQYTFETDSWNTLGVQSSLLPGPVDIFVSFTNSVSNAIVAGTYADNGTSYLLGYTGSDWKSLLDVEDPRTVIYDMQSLMLTKSYERNSTLIPEDSILLVTGNIVLSSYGNVSAAFFDGDSWTPYIVSTTEDGEAGSIFTVITQFSSEIEMLRQESTAHHLKVGYVILIGLAISLVLIFIIIAIGLFIAFWRRRSSGYRFPSNYDTAVWQSLPPSALFAEMSTVMESKR
ncbi:cortical protein marker for cell polarity-domain-containing protein [Dipodascopsis uninucleata]